MSRHLHPPTFSQETVFFLEIEEYFVLPGATFTTSHIILVRSMLTQCKISWNSCQDLAYSYIFPFTLETLDKILLILASHKPLEFLDSILGKSLIKIVKRMNSCETNSSFVYKYFAVVRTTSYTIIL